MGGLLNPAKTHNDRLPPHTQTDESLPVRKRSTEHKTSKQTLRESTGNEEEDG